MSTCDLCSVVESLNSWSNPYIQVAAQCVFPFKRSYAWTPDSSLCLRLSNNADNKVGISLKHFEMKRIWSCLPFLLPLISVLPVTGKTIMWAFLCRLCKQCVNLQVQLIHFNTFWLPESPHFLASLGYLEPQTKGNGIIYYESLNMFCFHAFPYATAVDLILVSV